MTPTTETTPARTELDGLRRVSATFLRVLRVAAIVIGLGAIGFAWWHGFAEPREPGVAPPDAGEAIAWLGLAVSFALPFLVPFRWLRDGRSRLRLLPPFFAAWFLPLVLGDPSPMLGVVLRLFASGIALATLVVWNLLFSLTVPPVNAPPS